MPNPAPRRRGRPVRLDREAIIAATDQMLTADGATTFSMRRLADRLGVSTAAIYHHYPTKSALFFAVLSARAGEIRRPELPSDPRDRLAAIVTYLIDTLHEMPWVIDILITGETYGHAAMWILDEFVNAATILGATDTQAVHMYTVMWRFALGELTTRKAANARSAAARHGRPTAHWTDSATPDLLNDFPSVARLVPKWMTAMDSYNSATAARDIIDGLVANLSSTRSS